MGKKTAMSPKRSILYYPTINIPTNSWLRNSLLYWDEVSSIVPQDYNHNKLIKLSSDIEFLMKEELFKPIRPDRLIYDGNNWEAMETFKKEFLETVETPEFKNLLKRSRQHAIRIHGAKIPKSGMIAKGGRIHRDKISDAIYYILNEKKLATKDPQYSEWMLFEGNTALLYMSILAKYLAYTASDLTAIGTDYRIYERFNFKPTSGTDGAPVVSVDFRGLIPSPSNSVSIKDIVKFKRKREPNLIAFRKMLLDVEKKLLQVKSNQEAKEIIVSFQEDLKRGLVDMASVFRDSKIDLIFKSLKSLVNYKSSTLVAGAAVFFNEKYKISGMPSWLEGIAIVTAGAIDIGSAYIESRNKLLVEDRKSAFSYLYHAQRAGIVPYLK